MKIRDKLILSFLLIALLSGVPLYFSLQAYDSINGGFNRVMHDPVASIKELEELRFAGVRIISSASEYGFIVNELENGRSHAMVKEEEELIESGHQSYDEAFKRYEAIAKQSKFDEDDHLSEIRKAGERLKEQSRKLISLKEKGMKGEEILELKEEFENDERAYLRAVDVALAHEYKEFEEEQKFVQQTITDATAKSVIVTGFVFFMAIMMGALISRKLGGHVSKLKNASEKIGAGELDTQVEVDSGDELGSLAKAFSKMALNLKSSRDEIVSSRNFMDNILSSMADALFIVTPDLGIIRANRAASILTGHTNQELLATPFHKLGGNAGLLSMGQLGDLIDLGMLHDIDGVCYSSDGRAVPVSTSASVIRNSSGAIQGYVLLVQDVTERKKLEGQLIHQALHDPLTKLANRTLFRDRLEHALKLAGRRKEPLTVLFLDLDNFKTVNDSMGHSAGDRLLVMAAQRLTGTLRASDTAARLGGDEFAVLVERPSNQYNGRLVAERLIEAFKKPFMIDGREVFISASIGITVPENSKQTPEELLRNSDVAMYIAKSQRKGGYVLFEPQMHADLLQKIELEADLRTAIAEEQFFLNYHPIIDLETGDIKGMETLVRWQHPVRGVIPPLEFIPLAESTGLIVKIGRWILSEACRQGYQWQSRYFKDKPFSLMVNLSAREFQEPRLAETIGEVLKESGLPARCLVLEITESMMMNNTEAMIEKLNELKALGVRLAIDDFGTGYSSLSYLERFPLDILKIDKSFVDKISGGGEEGTALTRAIISMGETLNLETVAEGIEKSEQVGALQHLGCELGQGFHFTRPLNSSDMEKFLTRQKFLPLSQNGQAGVKMPGF